MRLTLHVNAPKHSQFISDKNECVENLAIYKIFSCLFFPLLTLGLMLALERGGLERFISTYRFKSEASIRYPFTPTDTPKIYKSDDIELK